MPRDPFLQIGNTIAVAAATTAPSGITHAGQGLKATQFRVANRGLVGAHLAFGVDAGAAQSNAAIPTGDGGSSKFSMYLPPGAVEVISAPQGSCWSAITASGTTTIDVTPGTGV